MNTFKFVVAMTLAIPYAGAAWTQSGLTQESAAVSLGAHEHGRAYARIGIDSGAVLIEIQMTQADLAGFEGAARDAARQQTLADSRASLQRALGQVQFNGDRDCRLADVQFADTSADSGSHEGDDHGHRHHHDHDHEHDDQHNGGHEHDHRDVLATARWNCASTDALMGMELALWTAFPSLQRISVQWISERGQGALELQPGQTRINFGATSGS